MGSWEGAGYNVLGDSSWKCLVCNWILIILVTKKCSYNVLILGSSVDAPCLYKEKWIGPLV